MKPQQSVESIYIDVPISRYHQARSNSTPSEDTNLTTVIFNTPTSSSVNRHSPLAEEPFSGDEEDELASRREEGEQQTITNLNAKRIKKSKSDGQVAVGNLINLIDKCTINDKDTTRAKKSISLNQLKSDLILAKQSINQQQETKSHSSKQHSFKHYHSVDNILIEDNNLPHSISQIQRLLTKRASLASNQSDQLLSNKIARLELLKRKSKVRDSLARKEHYKSDNLILKNRHKLHELTEEFRSSLPQQNKQLSQAFNKPLNKQLQRSLTESETSSSCFARTSTISCSSSEQFNQIKSELKDKQIVAKQRQTSKSLSTTTDDSTDNETSVKTQDLVAKEERINYAINEKDTFERMYDEFNNRQSKKLHSIQEGRPDSELDQLYSVNQSVNISTKSSIQADRLSFENSARTLTNSFKMNQSATMFNIPSFNESTELLSINNQPIRRYQSAEQMLKRIIGNLHHFYRKQFKS